MSDSSWRCRRVLPHTRRSPNEPTERPRSPKTTRTPRTRGFDDDEAFYSDRRPEPHSMSSPLPSSVSLSSDWAREGRLSANKRANRPEAFQSTSTIFSLFWLAIRSCRAARFNQTLIGASKNRAGRPLACYYPNSVNTFSKGRPRGPAGVYAGADLAFISCEKSTTLLLSMIRGGSLDLNPRSHLTGALLKTSLVAFNDISNEIL